MCACARTSYVHSRVHRLVKLVLWRKDTALSGQCGSWFVICGEHASLLEGFLKRTEQEGFFVPAGASVEALSLLRTWNKI